MPTYVLYCANEATSLEVTASNPTTALRQLVANALLELASQRGRYGTLTDGRQVAALLTDTSRRRYPDHGTTRPLAPAHRTPMIVPDGWSIDDDGIARAPRSTTRADGDSFGPNLVPGKPDAEPLVPAGYTGTRCNWAGCRQDATARTDDLEARPLCATHLEWHLFAVEARAAAAADHAATMEMLHADLKARALVALELLADLYCDGPVVEMRSSAKVCLDDARALERRADYTHALLRAEHGLRYYGMHPRTLESGEVVYRRLGARS